MNSRLLLASLITWLAGCDRPGVPHGAQPVAHDSLAWTQSAFNTNCRGCHSQGAEGAALPLMNANYWAVATDAVVIEAIAHGQGRSMPAYLDDEGGPFTPAQIVSLVQGMRSLWGAKGSATGGEGGAISPRVIAGDAGAGAAVFSQACAGCHGPQGSAGSVIDPMYLRLISDQGLWSATIYGRSDLGMPSWSQTMPNRPTGLTAQEVADVVSFISSHRGIAQKASDGP
ncbi:MAG: c-type cytochrome [Phycisphaerales bacterium]|nr:c-type cytochrome [Phycisphaerales bacterium]